MSLANSSVLKDGTVSATGGTAKTLTSLGADLNQHDLFLDGTDIRTRTELVATTSKPKVKTSAPNGYTQQRSQMYLKVPLELDNGDRTVNTVQITFACDIETTDAEKDTILSYAAQLLSDSDYSSFWKDQAID